MFYHDLHGVFLRSYLPVLFFVLLRDHRSSGLLVFLKVPGIRRIIIQKEYLHKQYLYYYFVLITYLYLPLDFDGSREMSTFDGFVSIMSEISNRSFIFFSFAMG